VLCASVWLQARAYCCCSWTDAARCIPFIALDTRHRFAEKQATTSWRGIIGVIAPYGKKLVASPPAQSFDFLEFFCNRRMKKCLHFGVSFNRILHIYIFYHICCLPNRGVKMQEHRRANNKQEAHLSLG